MMDPKPPLATRSHQPGSCRVCGSSNVAAFCADCGGSQRPYRRTILDFVEELANSLVKGDTRTLRALRFLVMRPGELSIAEYSGGSPRLVSPVKLFFAVLVFYTLFFAVSPIKYGQLWVGLTEELPGYEAYAIEPGEVPVPTVLVEFFVPERDSAVTPLLRERFHQVEPEEIENHPMADYPTMEFLPLAGSPALEQEAFSLTTFFMAYLPLFVMFPAVVVNGLLYRRSRFIIDHVHYSFEIASIMPIAIVACSVIVLIIRQFGVIPPGDPLLSPLFVFGVIPVFALWIALADRRFYGTAIWALIPKTAVIIGVWYAMTEQITFYTIKNIIKYI